MRPADLRSDLRRLKLVAEAHGKRVDLNFGGIRLIIGDSFWVVGGGWGGGVEE